MRQNEGSGNRRWLRLRPWVGAGLLFWMVLGGVPEFSPLERAQAQGLGTLQVVPTRIVFEGRKRTDTVTVINQGDKEATYRIGFKNMRMLEDGSYEDVEQPKEGERFAEEMIRYSPRRVTLQPGESQVVRLLLRKKPDMVPGEYRSHMLFQSMPPEDAAAVDIEALGGEEGEIRVQLIPIFGVTIPVLIRHGDLSAQVQIADLKLEAPKNPGRNPLLSMRFEREGKKSVFGDIKVTFTPNDGGDTVEISRLNGVAVFTPNKVRVVRLRLTPPEGVKLENGQLHVEYRQPADEGGKLLAQAEGRVP